MDTRISQKEKQHDPLYRLVNSMPADNPPDDLSTRVMEQINNLHRDPKTHTFTIPVYIRFGIPLLLAICLTILLLQADPITIPTLRIPDNLIWLVGIGIVLFWGFFLLYRFLSKRFDYRAGGA